MAKYHRDLQYHEDTTEKHALTEGEIRFLLALQKEMDTQDHLSQADPRFWVIKGMEKVYGVEDGFEDGADLIYGDGLDVVAVDEKSAAEYIEENLLDKINEADGIQRRIEFSDACIYDRIRISWQDEGIEEEEFYDMGEIAEWLRDRGYDYRTANYRVVSKIYPNTMFLTQKAAEEHLRTNDYHYSEDAHTYAMTSWRNPETAMLWKILQEADWNQLLAALNPAAKDGAGYVDQPLIMPGA